MQAERRFHVLVVDDDSDVREALTECLVARGIEVVQAHDGIDAISCLSAREPLAVLLDLVMPRMSGVELIEQIRADRRWAKTPILAISGASKNLLRAKDAGADQVFMKPIDLVALADALERIAAARSRAAS